MTDTIVLGVLFDVYTYHFAAWKSLYGDITIPDGPFDTPFSLWLTLYGDTTVLGVPFDTQIILLHDCHCMVIPQS